MIPALVGQADGEIAESATSLWDTTVEALPRVGTAVVIVVIGWAASRGLRLLFRRQLGKRRTPSFATVVSKLLSWIFVAVVVLIAVAITFPSVKPVDLLAGLGFFSVAVGFAFQDILENTLAGILILFRQPFRSGDQITVLDQSGTVDAITIRETRIATFDGELVLIPNRDVYKNNIRVHTHLPDHRVQFTVGIAYENDPDEAIHTILEALTTVPTVRADPRPSVLVADLGVSSVEIAVMFWADARRAETLATLDEAIRAVKRHLDEAMIEMPAEIVVLQAAPSFETALHGGGNLTPGGGVRPATDAAPTAAAKAHGEHGDGVEPRPARDGSFR